MFQSYTLLRFYIQMNENWLYGPEKLPGLSRNGPHRDLNLRSLDSESRVLTITPWDSAKFM